MHSNLFIFFQFTCCARKCKHIHNFLQNNPNASIYQIYFWKFTIFVDTFWYQGRLLDANNKDNGQIKLIIFICFNYVSNLKHMCTFGRSNKLHSLSSIIQNSAPNQSNSSIIIKWKEARKTHSFRLIVPMSNNSSLNMLMLKERKTNQKEAQKKILKQTYQAKMS